MIFQGLLRTIYETELDKSKLVYGCLGYIGTKFILSKYFKKRKDFYKTEVSPYNEKLLRTDASFTLPILGAILCALTKNLGLASLAILFITC